MNRMVEKLVNFTFMPAASLVLFAAAAVNATPRPQDPTVPSRRTAPMTRDMRYREWQLKDLERMGKKKTKREMELAWAQIKEDFEGIQVDNNKLLAARLAGGEPNFSLVEKAAASINKHATRLDSNLALPEHENVGRRDEGLQLGTLLSALDAVIVRFVANPLFKETKVLDAKESSRARGDLRRIIELSDLIKKKARGATSK